MFADDHVTPAGSLNKMSRIFLQDELALLGHNTLKGITVMRSHSTDSDTPHFLLVSYNFESANIFGELSGLQKSVDISKIFK